ncbi:hypothetical protein GF357_00630 [Candidatus Dojkabacteria bacterium]|nr:hypothetical protein [Candidatus Dojkabacteria bacterium]
MKKANKALSLAVVAVAAGVVLSACGAKPEPQPAGEETGTQTPVCEEFAMDGYVSASDEDATISISYPEDKMEVTSQSMGTVHLLTKEVVPGELPTSAMALTAFYFEGGPSLKQNVDSVVEGLKAQSEFTLISREETTLSGLPAERLEYEYEAGDDEVRATQVITIYPEGEMVVYLTFNRDPAREDLAEVGNNIIKSFCIEK